MKYLRNKEENKNISVLIFLLIFLLIFCLYFRQNVISFFSAGTFEISVPFLKAKGFVSEKFSGIYSSIKDKNKLAQENEDLKKQLELSSAYIFENKILKEENNDLKEFINKVKFSEQKEGVLSAITRQPVLSFVLSGPSSVFYDSMILDAGVDKEIFSGDLVVSPTGFALGEIQEIYDNSSKVKLFSSVGLKTNVFLGKNNTSAEIEGIGSGNFFVSMPKDFLISEGDLAILPGEDRRIVGTVSDIEETENGSFKRVYLKSPENIREIYFVGIVGKIK